MEFESATASVVNLITELQSCENIIKSALKGELRSIGSGNTKQIIDSLDKALQILSFDDVSVLSHCI